MKRKASGKATTPRKAPEPARTAVVGAPRLTASLASIKRYETWLAAAILRRQVSHMQARDLTATIAGARATVRIEHQLHELDTLRRLVEKMEDAIHERKKQVASAQYAGNAAAGSDFACFAADDAGNVIGPNLGDLSKHGDAPPSHNAPPAPPPKGWQ